MAGPVKTLRQRAAAVDWRRAAQELDELGYARLPAFLGASECRQLARLYGQDARFRSTISMQPRRYGIGEYRYFAYPLPRPVAELRRAFYPPLARIANRWLARSGSGEQLPTGLVRFLENCRAHGQTRPTPLMLHYEAGGLNHLHQDSYGSIAFPLQVAFLLSRPGRDFSGGEFLLVEQHPRQQSRGEAIALRRGEGLIFPNRERPVRGTRGWYRVRVRHGVSRIHAGSRTTLGLIFHDAE